MLFMIKRLLSLLLLFSLLSACRSSVATPLPGDGLLIAASTTILADLTRNVIGSRGQVFSLLPPGADPHEYQASPSDVQRITRSSLLIMNGLGYEAFLQPLLENAGGERAIVIASAGLEPRSSGSPSGGAAPDPHMWLDPSRVTGYIENICDGLTRLDPLGAATYRQNADAYIIQLNQLDAWISEQVNTIPVDRRLLVTNHESMGYFAAHYGFTVVTTVLPGLSTEARTSARQLAAVIDQVKAVHAPAIFVGQLENTDLADQIAGETGAVVVNDLYLESLTQGPPAPTYIDMMKHNVQRIVTALQ